jgi:Rha family phage regulatory protein
MSITVFLVDGQLLVDSRLIAEELGIEHHNLLQNIFKYQSEIEQEFGQLLFQTEVGYRSQGGGNPEKYVLLNEGQADYLMLLSRNTDRVRAAKRKYVKAFSEAKKRLQGESAVDRIAYEALLKRNQKLESVLLKVAGFLGFREFALDKLPGLMKFVDNLMESKYVLPPARVEFTAPEWVDRNAPELTRRQRICFYKEIAAAHRFLIDKQPKKELGKYWYTNEYEMLFVRTKNLVLSMIPKESESLRITPTKYREHRHQLVGKTLVDVVNNDRFYLGLKIGELMPVGRIARRLGCDVNVAKYSVKLWVADGLIPSPTFIGGMWFYEVSITLIDLIKKESNNHGKS